jgi:hypothetical protein
VNHQPDGLLQQYNSSVSPPSAAPLTPASPSLSIPPMQHVSSVRYSSASPDATAGPTHEGQRRSKRLASKATQPNYDVPNSPLEASVPRNETSNKFICDIPLCTSARDGVPKSFKRKFELNRHKRTVHGMTTERYHCTDCSHHTPRLDKIQEHCRKVHKNGTSFERRTKVEHADGATEWIEHACATCGKRTR